MFPKEDGETSVLVFGMENRAFAKGKDFKENVGATEWKVDEGVGKR